MTSGHGGTPPGARPATPLLEGRRVDPGRRLSGEVSYSVVEPVRPGSEKRVRPRQRTRLRTGKIIDPNGIFLTECLVYDRSDTGGRLRLPAGVALTASIQLYEDQSAALYQADVVWRMEREVGIRFRPSIATARTRALEAEMRRRFYAVRDEPGPIPGRGVTPPLRSPPDRS